MMDPMDLFSLVYLIHRRKVKCIIQSNTGLTWNVSLIFCLMKDFNKIDGVEKWMILDIFISIGHTTKSVCDIDNKDLFN